MAQNADSKHRATSQVELAQKKGSVVDNRFGSNLDTSVDSGSDAGQGPGAPDGAAPVEGCRYLGVEFACCGVYTRVYINREGTAYEGRCPKCGKHVRIRVGPGGTDCRFFTAY